MRDKFFAKDELFLFLYVDDDALPFLSRSDALLGSEINLREISRLGLIMHLGKGTKESKTEAVFFSSRKNLKYGQVNTRRDFLQILIYLQMKPRRKVKSL